MLQPNLGTTLVSAPSCSPCSSPPACPAATSAASRWSAAARRCARHAWPSRYRRARFFAFLDPWADPGSHRLPDHPVAGVARLGRLARRRPRRGHAEVGLPARGPHRLHLRHHRRGARPGRRLRSSSALFVALGVLGVRAAAQAPDRFGLLLATGITTWFCVQAFVNIGAVIGILPDHRRPAAVRLLRRLVAAGQHGGGRHPLQHLPPVALDRRREPSPDGADADTFADRRRGRHGRPRAARARRRRARSAARGRRRSTSSAAARGIEARLLPAERLRRTRCCPAGASSAGSTARQRRRGRSGIVRAVVTAIGLVRRLRPGSSRPRRLRRRSRASLAAVAAGGCRSSSPSRTRSPARPTGWRPASPRLRRVLPRHAAAPRGRHRQPGARRGAGRRPHAARARRAARGRPRPARRTGSVVLVAGGSLGARSINDATVGLAGRWARPRRPRRPPRRRAPGLGRSCGRAADAGAGSTTSRLGTRTACRWRWPRPTSACSARARARASSWPPSGCRACSSRRRSSPATTRPPTPGGSPTPAAPCWCPTASSTAERLAAEVDALARRPRPAGRRWPTAAGRRLARPDAADRRRRPRSRSTPGG